MKFAVGGGLKTQYGTNHMYWLQEVTDTILNNERCNNLIVLYKKLNS